MEKIEVAVLIILKPIEARVPREKHCLRLLSRTLLQQVATVIEFKWLKSVGWMSDR